MQTHLTCSSAAIVAACLVAACSSSTDGSSTNGTFATSIGSWQSSLPANASAVQLGDAVEARGCTYTVGAATLMPPFPPQYVAFVQRSGNVHHCASGYMALGTSYNPPALAIAAGHGGLVADFSSKPTPSGAAHTHLEIVQLDEKTGDVVERATLYAMPVFNHPEQGNVWNGALEIGEGGSLTVRGDKNGIIPGEVGVGWHYVAVYEHFLHDKSDNPAPTSVEVFNAL